MAKHSDALFQRAQEVIPGGVNSPVRAFRGVGGTPPFIEQAQGSRIFDADNLQYIDCVGSWGPMILGHGHRYVVEAVKKAATRGFSFGAPTAGEIELAEMIIQAYPSMEMVRAVSSGASDAELPETVVAVVGGAEDGDGDFAILHAARATTRDVVEPADREPVHRRHSALPFRRIPCPPDNILIVLRDFRIFPG